MSAATLPAAAPTPTTAGQPGLAALARYETARLARHPLFVVAALLFVLVQLSIAMTEYPDADYPMTDGSETVYDWPVLPAFFLGLGGLIAMNRLTTSSDRAGDVLGATPVDESRRTLALCLAALLPALLALLGVAVELVHWHLDPPVNGINWGDFTWPETYAIFATGVLAALGGPLLGVLVARWWRWPLAASVVAVLLVLWTLATVAFTGNSPAVLLHHMAAPYTLVAQNTGDSSWIYGGHHGWRVAYLLGLCLLAALGAIGHGTRGEDRRRLLRRVAVVAALTLLALLLAAFTGDDGYWTRWDPRWT